MIDWSIAFRWPVEPSTPEARFAVRTRPGDQITQTIFMGMETDPVPVLEYQALAGLEPALERVFGRRGTER